MTCPRECTGIDEIASSQAIYTELALDRFRKQESRCLDSRLGDCVALASTGYVLKYRRG